MDEGLLDGPTLYHSARVKAGRGPGIEEAAGALVELVAKPQDVAQLGAGVGRSQLAAVEAVDLAGVLVGGKGQVDPAQPPHGRLYGGLHALGGGRGAHVEADHGAHHGLVVDGPGPGGGRRGQEIAHLPAADRADCRDWAKASLV